MLVINYNGKKPQQRHYDYSIIENNDVDIIKFVLQSKICSYYEFEDLMTFVSYVKIESAGKEYIDKIECDKAIENGFLCVYLYLSKKMTQYKNISVQLSFESGDEYDVEVAQTEIVALTLSGSILADKEVDEKYPYAIQQLEQKVNTFDGRIKEADEKAEEAKEIIIDNPSDYLNENGLDKIIRVEDENGNVEKSYFIDRIHHERTIVKCEPHREENGFFYVKVGEIDFDENALLDDLGNDNFFEIFGEDMGLNYEGEGESFISSLYYNQNGEITKGIVFDGTSQSTYIGLQLETLIPNKEITFVVGKYFEYDEQGNKVFDEKDANFFCEKVVGNEGNAENRITQERQEFKVNTTAGSLYFDCDATGFGGSNRFILYEIRTGKPAYDEYEEHEIGGSEQQFLPVFKPTQTLQEVYDYFLANKEKCSSDGITLSFAIMGDENEWGNTIIAKIQFYDTNFNFVFRNENAYFDCQGFDLTQNLSNTLGTIMNGYDNAYDYALRSDVWDGTQEEYDNMSSHDGNVTYYIREE